MKTILCVMLWIALSIFGSGCSGGGKGNAGPLIDAAAGRTKISNEENLVIYLNASSGQPTVAGDDPRSAVRLMVRNGEVPAAYSVISAGDNVVDEGGGFRRVFPDGEPYKKGILHFEAGRGLTASVWEPPGLDAKNGFIQVDKDVFLQYTYFATGNADHKKICEFALRWYNEQNP